MNTTQQQKGFTIIEVVLVLAIAALIFLMIFIAWPALQRGQRDTARKEDASSIVAAISSFRTNNPSASGTPTVAQIGQYTGTLSQLTSPGTTTTATAATSPVTNAGTTTAVHVVYAATCSSSNDATFDATGSKKFVVMYRVEAGGTAQKACQQG